MIPHTLVLEPGRQVYKIYNGYWFFGRPTVEELRLDLRAVLRRCRPDWDIASVEQRAAWEKGDTRTDHHGEGASTQTEGIMITAGTTVSTQRAPERPVRRRHRLLDPWRMPTDTIVQSLRADASGVIPLAYSHTATLALGLSRCLTRSSFLRLPLWR